MKRNEEVKNYIKNNALPVTMQITALISTLVALYITTRLAPIIQSVALANQKIEIIEEQVKSHATREEIQDIKEDIKEIKVTVNSIYQLHLK